MLVLNEPHLKMEIDERSSPINLKWTGFAISSDYRAGLEAAVRKVREFNIQLWLADLRDMMAILKNDEDWTNTEWFPTLNGTGLKKMAIIESSDYFNKSSVDRIMDTAEPSIPFTVSYFREVGDGQECWCEQRIEH